LEPPKDGVIRARVVDLMPGALRARVEPRKRDAPAQAHVHIPAPLLDIRARPNAQDPPRIILMPLLEHKRILQLPWIDFSSSGRGICDECGLWGSKVVLEQAVVLVGHAAYAAEHGAAHEPVRVRAKAVDDVVVVPDVDLG